MFWSSKFNFASPRFTQELWKSLANVLTLDTFIAFIAKPLVDKSTAGICGRRGRAACFSPETRDK
eukprot:1395086-Pyramimonas_sp.AAC.1